MTFSALQRAEIAEIFPGNNFKVVPPHPFSALQRAEIAEIPARRLRRDRAARLSVLFNEPKLLKSRCRQTRCSAARSFSALQRAEIAEISPSPTTPVHADGLSVLFNEPKLLKSTPQYSARRCCSPLSVLFNEPKLLKCPLVYSSSSSHHNAFQCSSTSRNC